MTDYFQLLTQKEDFLAKLRQGLKDADDNRALETASATCIQRRLRGNVAREEIRHQTNAVNRIKRLYKGYMGRKAAERRAQEVYEEKMVSVFNYFACQIQKSLRGFKSRKYKHDFYRRKEYISNLIKKGEDLRRSQEAYSQAQETYAAMEAQRLREKEFVECATNLHHLVSTNQIKGVFNPVAGLMEMPTLNDVPVEEQIRGVVRDLLRAKGVTKRGIAKDLGGSRQVPYRQGIKNRLSVQASAPYEVHKQADKDKAHLHRILTRGKESFLGGTRYAGKNRLNEIGGGIMEPFKPTCVGDTYLDTFRNPYLVRGIPNSIKELKQSRDLGKPLFITHQERAFTSRTGGNKSSTLPNDLFDVIADAAETGGAAQRQLGTGTARFGLPANCDNRPYSMSGQQNSTIPNIPLRVTTFRHTKPPPQVLAASAQRRAISVPAGGTMPLDPDMPYGHATSAPAGNSTANQQQAESYISDSDDDV